MNRPAIVTAAIGLAAFALVPWYAVPSGIWSGEWVSNWPGAESAPGLFAALSGAAPWLAPVGLFLLAASPAMHAVFTYQDMPDCHGGVPVMQTAGLTEIQQAHAAYLSVCWDSLQALRLITVPIPI